MKKATIALGVALLAGCATASPPPVPPAYAPPNQPPPVYALLGERDKLGLSSEQIAALDSIGQWVSEANEPLIQRLRERGGEPGRSRRDPGRGRDPRTIPGGEVRSAVEEIRQNNQRAAEGVRALLSPEQQQQTCELFRERRESARERQAGASAPARRGRGAPGDSVAAGPAQPWFWCTQSAPTATPGAR